MKTPSWQPPVLVVDDDVFVRMAAVDMLTEHGFVIHEAGSAQQALDVLAAHPEIGTLLTDINMPGAEDGLRLAERIAQMRPDIAIIVTSGRAEPDRSALANSTFLPKPFAAQGLIWAVEHAGNAGSAG